MYPSFRGLHNSPSLTREFLFSLGRVVVRPAPSIHTIICIFSVNTSKVKLSYLHVSNTALLSLLHTRPWLASLVVLPWTSSGGCSSLRPGSVSPLIELFQKSVSLISPFIHSNSMNKTQHHFLSFSDRLNFCCLILLIHYI